MTIIVSLIITTMLCIYVYGMLFESAPVDSDIQDVVREDAWVDEQLAPVLDVIYMEDYLDSAPIEVENDQVVDGSFLDLGVYNIDDVLTELTGMSPWDVPKHEEETITIDLGVMSSCCPSHPIYN